jgi:hypothetical protein
MACLIAHTTRETIIRLPPELAEDDFNVIESGFESAVDRCNHVVIIDFAETHHVNASLVALMGMLRLRARRIGVAVEVRNLSEDLGDHLTTPALPDPCC